MIGRLFRGLAFLLVCICVGTMLSAAGLGAYLAVKWQIGRDKFVKMLAVAQGVDLAPAHPQAPTLEPSEEQVSYDRILEARAARFRDLELREQALRSGLAQLRSDQGRLAEERAVLAKSREAFQNELAQVQKEALDEGWEQNRNSLASIKPKQAKELLLAMMAKNEIEDVVALLGPMTDSKRAKIISEFKTPEETQKIDEILRLIRRGEPRSAAAANASQQLGTYSPREGTNR